MARNNLETWFSDWFASHPERGWWGRGEESPQIPTKDPSGGENPIRNHEKSNISTLSYWFWIGFLPSDWSVRGGGDSPPRPDQSRSECNEIYCKNMFLIRFQTQKLRKMFRNGLGTILDKTQNLFFMIFDQIFASILIHLWEFGETPRHSPANPARGVPKINRKITFLDCFQTQIHPQSVQERFRNDFRQSWKFLFFMISDRIFASRLIVCGDLGRLLASAPPTPLGVWRKSIGKSRF